MFILLRRIERWLHQHVFKVGWLTTQNYQTTTILYYTVFLPGVILHEVVYYLAAGLLNVRAERDIKWPDEQEVGELQLNFVKIAPRTSAFRKAWITSAPLFVGLIVIWLVASNIFDITAVTSLMSSGELRDVGAAINLLLSAPLFWFWVYIVFTVANTMFPTVPKDLKGWRSILIGLAVVATALVAIGIGGSIFEVLQTPLNNIIGVLQATFILIMGIDVAMVLILGLIEYTIERITGNSATFKGNRMYTMTREEAIAERERQREAARKKAEREKKKREAQTAGPQTVYALSFSVPDSPKVEGVTPLFPEEPEPEEIEEVEEAEVERPKSMPSFGGLAEDGNAKKPELTEEEKRQREAIAARVNLFGSSEDDDTSKDGAEVVEEAEETIEKLSTSAPMPTSTPIKSTTTDKSSSTPSRLGRPTTSPATEDADDALSTPPRRFSKPATESVSDDSDKTIEQPAASQSSRFGSGIRGFGDTSTKDNDDEEITTDKPQSSVGRFGQGVTPPNTKEDTEKPTISSRFGTSARRFGQPRTEDADIASDDSKDAEKSETTTSSSRFETPSRRFGQSTTEDADIASDDSKDAEKSETTTSSSRFGTPSRRFGQSTTEDADIASDDSKDAEKSETITSSSRFGSRSFLGSTSEDDDKDVVSTAEDTEAEPVEESIRVVGRPATPSKLDDADEDDEALDEAIARRGRGDDGAVASLFGQLDDDEDDEAIDSTLFGKSGLGSNSRFGSGTSRRFGATKSNDDESVSGSQFGSTLGSGSSRFGSGSFLGDADDEENDEANSGKSSGLSQYRQSTPISSRFGSSRPAPKPSDRFKYEDDDDDDDLDDDIVYEDIDDIDYYDEDDEYYYDDDD